MFLLHVKSTLGHATDKSLLHTEYVHIRQGLMGESLQLDHIWWCASKQFFSLKKKQYCEGGGVDFSPKNYSFFPGPTYNSDQTQRIFARVYKCNTIVDVIINSAMQYQLVIFNCMNHPSFFCIVQCLAFQHMERFGDFITVVTTLQILGDTYQSCTLNKLISSTDFTQLVLCTTSC